MNDPWNRFVLPSIPSLDENIESSATQPIPTGGILGNFGQSAEPPMGLRPAATAPVLPPWSQTWSFASPAQTPDPDTLRFQAAWRRLYSSPAFSARGLSGNIDQPGAQFNVSCHIVSNIRAGLFISGRRRAAASRRSVLRSAAAICDDIGGIGQRPLSRVCGTIS
jgi:hypothetical protein